MKSLAAVTVAVAAVALAGCSYVNPITTQQYYAASDGVHLNIDDIEAQNLILFTSGAGEPAALVGTLVNRGTDDIELRVSFDGETATVVAAPAGTSVALSPLDGVEVPGISPVLPGQVTEVGFATDRDGYFSMNIPVMDGTLPQYTAIVDAIG